MDALIVLIDVDHTLLDGDAVRARISDAIVESVGEAAAVRFWELYPEVRAELGRVDVLETAARLEAESNLPQGVAASALRRTAFAACLHPRALEVVAHLGTLGRTVVLSDGETTFQRLKIVAAGIEAAVEGRVMITTHKEDELDEVRRRFPADHYVLIDDRVGILASVKAELGARVTTVLVRQGRYAAELDTADVAAPDLVVTPLAELLAFDREMLMAGAR